MEFLVFIAFIAFMLILLPALFSVKSENEDDNSTPTYTGRPRTCIQHSWIYNESKELYCGRCARKPGEMQ